MKIICSLASAALIIMAINCKNKDGGKRSSGPSPSVDPFKEQFNQGNNAFTQNPDCKSSQFRQELNNPSITLSGGSGLFSGNAKVRTGVILEAKEGSMEMSTSYQLNDTSAGVDGDDVRKELNKVFGLRAGELFRGNWEEYYKSRAPGVKCALFPIVTMAQPDLMVKVEFSPGLPYLVSPAETPEVYATELKGEMSFTDITATVSEAGSSGLPAGTVITGGRVTVRPVPPQEGATHAFEVNVDFGGVAKTIKLGLLPKLTYHIAAGRFVAVIAHTGGVSDKVTVSPPNVVYK